jgi:recombination protein RecT
MQSKGIVDIVMGRVGEFIHSGQLIMPKDYSPENALKAAWLALQSVEDKAGNKALAVCTRDSIANSLLDMVVQGLNPSKDQCYFIVHGKALTCRRSYFGSMAVAQMVQPKIKDWGDGVVYAGDTFKYGIRHGKKYVEEHVQDIKNINPEAIVAAYSIAIDENGEPFKTEIMTYDQIKQSWKKSQVNPFDEKGNLKSSSEHGKAPDQFALRTVINRNCKIIINSSSDNALLLDRINRNEDLADAAAAAAEIEEHANTGDLVQIPEQTGVDEQTGEVTGPGAVLESEQPAETHAEAVCVCAQMMKEGLKEWDCPVHGRYQGGKFTKPSDRKPNF